MATLIFFVIIFLIKGKSDHFRRTLHLLIYLLKNLGFMPLRHQILEQLLWVGIRRTSAQLDGLWGRIAASLECLLLSQPMQRLEYLPKSHWPFQSFDWYWLVYEVHVCKVLAICHEQLVPELIVQ